MTEEGAAVGTFDGLVGLIMIDDVDRESAIMIDMVLPMGASIRAVNQSDGYLCAFMLDSHPCNNPAIVFRIEGSSLGCATFDYAIKSYRD